MVFVGDCGGAFEGGLGPRCVTRFVVQVAELHQVGGHALPVAAILHLRQRAGEVLFGLRPITDAAIGDRDVQHQRIDLVIDPGIAEAGAGTLEIQQGLGLLAQLREQFAAQHQTLAKQLPFR